MTAPALLDLGEIDPAQWRILVRGTVYGPYTLGQVRSFVEEGRLGAHSKIAKGEFAPFERVDGVGDLEDLFETGEVETESEADTAQTELSEAPQSDPGNFIIFVRGDDNSEDASDAVFDVLSRIGHVAEAMPNAFILKADIRTGDLQRQLNSAVDQGVSVLIVNASRNRLAWCHLDRDASEHLRSVWDGHR